MAQNIFCSIGLKLRPRLFLLPSVWCRDELSDGIGDVSFCITGLILLKPILNDLYHQFFAENTKTRLSHNDVIFALVTSVRYHESSHRCVRYVFYISSKPFPTSLRRSGHIAVWPCFVPCWVDKVLVESNICRVCKPVRHS